MFENLEKRRLLAAHIVNPGINGVLSVDGTTVGDTIDLSVVGNDLVVVINGGAPEMFDFSGSFDDGEWHELVVNGDTGNDTVNLSADVFSAPGASGVTINGDSGNDEINSGPGNDSIFGGAGDDTIHGSDGNDVIDGGSGADEMFGDDGQDIASYETRTGSVTIILDAVANDGETGENDLIDGSIDAVVGGSGADTITNTTANNKALSGGAGNDTITGGVGSDEINGGDGDDLMDGSSNEDTFNGGAGTDTVDYSSRGSAVNVTLDSDDNDGESGEDDNVMPDVEIVLGSDHDDILSAAGDSNAHTLLGGLGNDTIVGGSVADSLSGGAGDDSINGGAGDDNILGGDGIDIIHGDAGNDVIACGDGNDSAYGGTGNDSIAGDLGNDYLTGDENNDTVAGGDGNDRLLGGANDDHLFGDAGNDQLAPGRGKDTLTGGTGTDRADYYYETKSMLAYLDGTAHSGIKNEQDLISTDMEDLRGGAGNDFLFGSGSKNYMIGGAGNDTLNGNGGSDLLSGEAGNDSLVGGTGNDRLRGGAGTDRMLGGTGNDTADYTDHTQNLIITIDATANDGATGENDFVSPDVETVLSGSGNDQITGSAAKNLIRAGDGNDTVTGGAGSDTIFGEAGNDTFHTVDLFIDTIADHIGTDVLDKDANDVVL